MFSGFFVSEKRWWVIGVGVIMLLITTAFFYLRKPRNSPEQSIATARNTVLCIQNTASGGRLAAGFSDGRVLLWDTTNKTPLSVKLPTQWSITCLNFTSSGKLLVGGLEQHVLIWDPQRLRADKFPMFSEPVVALASRPRSSEIIVALKSGAVLSGFPGDQALKPVISGHQGTVKTLTYTLDGLTWISGGADGQLIWHDANKQTILRKINAHRHEVSHIRLRQQGETLASAGWDGVVHLWDQKSEQPQLTLRHSTPIAALSFPNQRLLCLGWDHQYSVWDLPSQSPTATGSLPDSCLTAELSPTKNEVWYVTGDGQWNRIPLSKR